MLQQGLTLQNRYQIQRQIGGGGMGQVYLATDNRLPGRRCAIKAMSPDQLPSEDRNWAIANFRQEAQMLATLRHHGLAAVTDIFAEYGNWYLVMDYIEGETLGNYLAQHGGRLTVDEALHITRQLCEVLAYLHNQTPPVIFRDLKPGNVMLTRQGDVKLIDFGIARFFKPGKTGDTVNLGTPGYAAPEQYGKMGAQSGPRADVYSLGVLLLQMMSGYDPTTASTPFPLPDPDSLLRGAPPYIVRCIAQATQVQPDLRYGSIREMQQALFPPTYPLPSQPQPQSASPKPKRNWLLFGGCGLVAVILLVACVAVMWFSGVFSEIIPAISSPVTPLPPTPTSMDTPSPPPPTLTVSEEATDIPVPPPDQEREATKVPTIAPTPRPTDTPVPTPSFTSSWDSIGESVRGRDLSVFTLGYDEGHTAVVVVGSIQGSQLPTTDLIDEVIDDFRDSPSQVPQATIFYFIPSINPDGNASNSRFNANGVDLNRNWDTDDWTSNAAVPGYPSGKPGAGGSRPFSEPETRSLSNFLLQLESRYSKLRVVILHTSVSSPNEVYAGGDSATGVANAYAAVVGYEIGVAWGAYTPTGEVITWCEDQGIVSIDVIIPANGMPSISRTIQALLRVSEY